jgi:hypothetical protein
MSKAVKVLCVLGLVTSWALLAALFLVWPLTPLAQRPDEYWPIWGGLFLLALALGYAPGLIAGRLLKPPSRRAGGATLRRLPDRTQLRFP